MLDGWDVRIDLPAKMVEASHGDGAFQATLMLEESPESGWIVVGASFSSHGGRLSNRLVREVSFAAVEQMVREVGAVDDGIRSVKKLPPRRSPDFFHAVSELFLAFKASGASSPVRSISELENVPLKTVQGWITEARRMSLLPPGTPGKAG